MAQERVTVDPNRMRGLPCIRNTRVTVSAVLGQLAAGASIDEVLADYPCLERENILAVSEYTAVPGLSDLGVRVHGLAESAEGELINDDASVRRLLDS